MRGTAGLLREHLTMHALRLEKEGRPPPRPVTVGFIAFYRRAQIQCLRRTLKAASQTGLNRWTPCTAWAHWNRRIGHSTPRAACQGSGLVWLEVCRGCASRCAYLGGKGATHL